MTALDAALGWGLVALLCAVILSIAIIFFRYRGSPVKEAWTPPAGHVLHRVHRFMSGELDYWVAQCECLWSERAMSEGAARGALDTHLHSARPWEKYTDPAVCPVAGCTLAAGHDGDHRLDPDKLVVT